MLSNSEYGCGGEKTHQAKPSEKKTTKALTHVAGSLLHIILTLDYPCQILGKNIFRSDKS